MKLYTEEQLRDFIDRNGCIVESDLDEKQLTPTELPSDVELWRWWKTQKFQKEQGEQEYKMLYEIDLAKILKAFIEHFIKTGGEQ
jgi:hypothetical protein